MALEISGADYLRRLKREPQGTSIDIPAPAPAPMTPDPPTEADRRRSPRYECEGSAEFRQDGSDVRTWGTFTDISLQGCYVEMTATFPVGTVVDLGLELKGLRVEVKGEVKVTSPFLGMGVAFVKFLRTIVFASRNLCTRFWRRDQSSSRRQRTRQPKSARCLSS